MGAVGEAEDAGAPRDKPPPDEGGRCALTHVRVGDPRDEPPPEEGGGVPSPMYGWGPKRDLLELEKRLVSAHCVHTTRMLTRISP